MSERLCERSWQAEAVLDGTLVGADRASFERHAESCATCAGEMEVLLAVDQAMLGVEGPALTPLDRRRMQAALLQRAHARRAAKAPRRHATWLWMAAAAALAMVAWIVVGRAHPFTSTGASTGVASGVASGGVSMGASTAASAASGLVAPPTFEVVSLSGQAVTSTAEGGVAHASLVAGTAAFHVVHLTAGQRFLLELPDGELEVHGTRFVVEVGEGRTQQVTVDEGLVALRIRGDVEHMLGAGQRWGARDVVAGRATSLPPPAKESASATPSTAIASASAPAESSAPPKVGVAKVGVAKVGVAKVGVAKVGVAKVAATKVAKEGAREADVRFDSAMAAFHGGQYATAAQQLAAFELDFPDDFRCEDAHFVRAVATSRGGDATGADALARSYLSRYPQGLRRREVEALLLGGASMR